MPVPDGDAAGQALAATRTRHEQAGQMCAQQPVPTASLTRGVCIQSRDTKHTSMKSCLASSTPATSSKVMPVEGSIWNLALDLPKDKGLLPPPPPMPP